LYTETESAIVSKIYVPLTFSPSLVGLNNIFNNLPLLFSIIKDKFLILNRFFVWKNTAIMNYEDNTIEEQIDELEIVQKEPDAIRVSGNQDIALR
jgi:hypothetical protein